MRKACRRATTLAPRLFTPVLALVIAIDASVGWSQTREFEEPETLGRSLGRSGSRFRLFGQGDFAETGLRMPADFTGCTDNTSNLTTERQCWSNFNPRPLGRYSMPDWFDMFFYWAVPSSERNKHAATVPSLGNATDKGYTLLSRIGDMPGEILPMDGTLGPFHAGATEAGDGSCLDFRTMPSGVPLLAASDCPPTWGSRGWQGTRSVDQEGFLAYADQVGDANFAFDSWRVPQELRRNDNFLGDFQTFGFFQDYSAETLFGGIEFRGEPLTYGNVIPESTGGDPDQEPTRSGWPLGLAAKMDAFAFFAPGLANTAWFQIDVTNRSREVYGVGLDYDSLYMGILPGWLTYAGTSLYRDPANGVTRGAAFCQTPGCGPGGDPMHPATSWGAIPPNGIGEGFNYGAAAIIVLKSPIGDLRNKQFTDPGSRFFGVGDRDAWDDTITFNHGHMCGFHGCSAVIWNGIASAAPNSDFEQRQFGMVASITDDVIGDRFTGDIANHTAWDTWRWEEYPDRTQLDFNKWTPGGWDYNEDDEPDTLFFDDCSGVAGPQYDAATGYAKNCAVSWSDTLPGGFGNVYVNRGAVTGAGPFRLPADSTAEWVIAVVAANDSISIESDIHRAIRHYMTFYSTPDAAPPPAITSIAVDTEGDHFGDPGQPEAEATLFFDAASEDWEDPYLQAYLDELLAADPRTELGKLRLLNPGLEDTLRTLIPNNVAALYVFRSCDAGRSFTADGDCQPDAPNAGEFRGLGWFPWLTLDPDRDGDFPNSVSDDAVLRGRSFFYSIVTRTRGLELPVLLGEPDSAVAVSEGDTVFACVRDCRTETLRIAPSLFGPLATAAEAPNAASVYVPASYQSGSAGAGIELLQPSPDRIPFGRMNVRPTADAMREGEYRLRFADEIVVEEYAMGVPPRIAIDSTLVTAIDVGVDTLVLRADGEVAVEGEYEESADTMGASVSRRRVYRFEPLAAVLSDADERPLMVTASLSGGQTVPGRYFGLPDYPGFTLSIDNSLAGDFAGQYYLYADGEGIGPLVEPSVTFLAELAEEPGEGRYRVTWADEAFGEAAPFRLDFSNAEAVRERVVESLQGREAGQLSASDPGIPAYLGLTPDEFLTAFVPLVRLPFAIEDVTDPDRPAPVHVLFPRDWKQSEIVLGSGVDSLIVEVPESEWVPGDRVMLLKGSAPEFEVVARPAVIGCEPSLWKRTSCNPVAIGSPGATGYVGTAAGQALHFGYYQTITARTEFAFAARSAVAGARLEEEPGHIRAALDSVKVVPNPFLVASRYTTADDDFVLFTHVPPRGVLRIFTASGQFVQQLRWDPAGLNGQGDLRFNLVTKEGLLMAAGLYLYVLTAEDEQGREVGVAKGKFVIIR